MHIYLFTEGVISSFIMSREKINNLDHKTSQDQSHQLRYEEQIYAVRILPSELFKQKNQDSEKKQRMIRINML